MKGIEPPHPTYTGLFPNTSSEASLRGVFNSCGRSGASKPSPESKHSNSRRAPKVSGPLSVNFSFKV